ncbi:unnamed protein product [Caenorhabditis auriculariae]|uniref:Uncharacterized protein n=1 Tax=Caenorhabditis auriculariae TaxID=2777116 RepID=A0A8S1H0D1_9PELO|nr:unnamed protein product [Caenorhabditis auriculariae]
MRLQVQASLTPPQKNRKKCLIDGSGGRKCREDDGNAEGERISTKQTGGERLAPSAKYTSRVAGGPPKLS